MILCRTKTCDCDLVLLSLGGKLVLGKETQTLRNTMQELIESGFKHIVIDLREVEKIDCAGLGELVRCRATVHHAGARITLQNLPYRVRELLVLTRLITLFDWHDLAIPRAA